MAGGHSLNLSQGPGPRSAGHPERIRDGQVFVPLHGRHHLRAVVRRVEGEWARVLREDGREARLSLDRLLAVDEHGHGVHYRYCGWHPRPRGYRAELRVVGVMPERGRCEVVLPEWDAEAAIEQPLGILPAALRREGAVGRCVARLSSDSAAGLEIHSCRAGRARVGSRRRRTGHPELAVPGQRYRRRRDDATFRVSKVTPSGVRAWNGHRLVALSAERLLARRGDGSGRHYEYLGGGLAELRRRR